MNIEGIGSRFSARATVAAVLVLALAASLLGAQSANAQSLSGKRAERMAEDLVKRQLRDRDRRLVQARISPPSRVNRRVVSFLYDDLNRQGVVCVGTIQVRRSGNRFIARFVNTRCTQPGEEALAFRAQARAVAVRVQRKQRSVQRGVTRYVRNAQACENLDVPADRVDEASLLLSAGLTQATIRPLSGTLDDYASTLQALDVTDTQLAAGANAWRHFLDSVRALPNLRGGYCGALAEWGRNGYTDESAPVDFAALRLLASGIRANGGEVRRTARLLRRKGIDPITVSAFTLDNLIAEVAISETGAGGSR